MLPIALTTFFVSVSLLFFLLYNLKYNFPSKESLRAFSLCTRTRTHTHKPIIFLIPLDKSLQMWHDYKDIMHCKLVEKVPWCRSAHRRNAVVEIWPVVWQNTQRYLKHAQQLYPLSYTHTHKYTLYRTFGKFQRYTNSNAGSITKWEHTSVGKLSSPSLCSRCPMPKFWEASSGTCPIMLS